MKYTYAYKTSDGARHEGAMDASSREEVFEELRRAGIKAIKVVASDGSKANGEVRGVRMRTVVAISVTAAVLAGIAAYMMSPPRRQGEQAEERPPEIAFTSEEYRTAFTNLEARSAQILMRHFETIKALDMDDLADYRLVESTRNAEMLKRKVRQGYRTVDDSRMAVRDLFKTIFSIFPAECRVEREEAQRLYAETMDRLEVSERRIVKDEKALQLLVGNRGKWRCLNGKVVWDDAALANEFEYFRRDANQSAVRLHKNLGAMDSRTEGSPSVNE